jgi:hypothetical protein
MSKLQESVTDNCHFQRKGKENQYKPSAQVISNLKEARSILEKSDMNTQKVVAAKENISECISLLRTGASHNDLASRLYSDMVFLSAFEKVRFISSSSSEFMGLLWYYCATFQPKSGESAS